MDRKLASALTTHNLSIVNVFSGSVETSESVIAIFALDLMKDELDYSDNSISSGTSMTNPEYSVRSSSDRTVR